MQSSIPNSGPLNYYVGMNYNTTQYSQLNKVQYHQQSSIGQPDQMHQTYQPMMNNNYPQQQAVISCSVDTSQQLQIQNSYHENFNLLPQQVIIMDQFIIEEKLKIAIKALSEKFQIQLSQQQKQFEQQRNDLLILKRISDANELKIQRFHSLQKQQQTNQNQNTKKPGISNLDLFLMQINRHQQEIEDLNDSIVKLKYEQAEDRNIMLIQDTQEKNQKVISEKIEKLKIKINSQNSKIIQNNQQIENIQNDLITLKKEISIICEQNKSQGPRQFSASQGYLAQNLNKSQESKKTNKYFISDVEDLIIEFKKQQEKQNIKQLFRKSRFQHQLDQFLTLNQQNEDLNTQLQEKLQTVNQKLTDQFEQLRQEYCTLKVQVGITQRTNIEQLESLKISNQKIANQIENHFKKINIYLLGLQQNVQFDEVGSQQLQTKVKIGDIFKSVQPYDESGQLY